MGIGNAYCMYILRILDVVKDSEWICTSPPTLTHLYMSFAPQDRLHGFTSGTTDNPGTFLADSHAGEFSLARVPSLSY